MIDYAPLEAWFLTGSHTFSPAKMVKAGGPVFVYEFPAACVTAVEVSLA